jgi:N-acetylneuraminic acid mutarotase
MRFVPILLICFSINIYAQSWEVIETTGNPLERHENSLTSIGENLYVLGGRGIKAIDVLNTKTNVWTSKSEPPLEIHHFQAITYKGEIYVVGAFTGGYPHETPIPNIYIYNPGTDTWRKGAEIPRKRGAAGVFVYEDKIYVVCGIQDGHWDGHVTWFDEYSPETDLFDFKTNTWETLPTSANIPTERAGCSAVAKNGKLIIIGGESKLQKTAHREVEALNPVTNTWEKLPALRVTRHGTGATMINGKIYTAAGSLNRGGGPELSSVECLEN